MGCVCSRQTEPEMQIKFDKNEGKEKQENSNGRIKESYNNFLTIHIPLILYDKSIKLLYTKSIISFVNSSSKDDNIFSNA